jgi:hypothetical protein
MNHGGSHITLIIVGREHDERNNNIFSSDGLACTDLFWRSTIIRTTKNDLNSLLHFDMTTSLQLTSMTIRESGFETRGSYSDVVKNPSHHVPQHHSEEDSPYSHHNTPPEGFENAMEDTVVTPLTEALRGSPKRGVRRVSSVRRGAAGYAQLLHSAVTASIEVTADGSLGNSECFAAASLINIGDGTNCNEPPRPKRERDDVAPPALLRRSHSRTYDVVPGKLVSHHRRPHDYVDGDDDADESMDLS